MSFGLPRGASGAPMSGKHAKLFSNGHQNKVARGTSRPSKGSVKDPKGPKTK